MIPVYRYMDSLPFQKNQMPFNPYQYPNMETIPSYTMIDPAQSYMPPNDSGCNTWCSGYPVPVYSCCNGGNFFPGSYGFRPPHLPVPSHQHMHCYGGYPSCPEPYYVPYVPPPHYNVEQPRYEFDKNMMRNHHCCGCTKNLCGQTQNEGKCARIEEEKPDVHRKESLVPVQLGNNQCPIVWIPPNYTGKEKEREPSETGTMKQEKEHHSLNLTEKAPKFWSGWPLSDLSRLRSWLPDAEGTGAQSVQNKQQKDGKKELPFPVIWMPARKNIPNMDAPTKPTAEPSTNEGPEVVKTINESNVPEKDMDHKTEDTKENKERRCIPVETVKDRDEEESSGNNVKRQYSSSPKKSRLPPVCLRVDPLSKKKNSNGSLNSHSSLMPTAAKENSLLDSKIDNATVEHDSEEIIKTVEVRTHGSPDGNQGDKENISRNRELLKFFDELCKVAIEESTGNEDGRISHASTEKVVDEGLEVKSDDLVQEEGKIEKPNLSDVEAAVLIQSAYRGYEVRKWELLKKMKQLVEVRQQIIEVQNGVKALELAPRDEKERMFIGEMIMRLLLKLDTIQGLNPSVREFRKSLAKELVSLQEKIDCMTMTTKPTEAVQEATMEKPAEYLDVETQDNRKEEEQDGANVVAIGEIFSEGVDESNSLLGKSDEAQCLCGIENMAGFEGSKSHAGEELQSPTGDRNSKLPLPEVNDENTTEAEQVVELRELRGAGVQNEDTSELYSQNVSKPLEGEKVVPSLIGDKKLEEAESKAEMEQNVELVTDAEQKVGEVLRMDMEGGTDNYQANSFDVHPSLEVDDQVGAQTGLTPQVLDKIAISVPDENENGETEAHLVTDKEVPMREDDNPSNFEADEFEHIEMRREVSEAEEDAHDLAIELSRGGEGPEGCHDLNVGSEQNEERSQVI